MHYDPKTFSLPSISGISDTQIAEHIKLYEGYVKHVNLIAEQIETWSTDYEANTYPIRELWRRFGFEFDGMRNHEYYFNALESGPQALDAKSTLGTALARQFGSVDAWREAFTRVAGTRGSGWTMLYFDPENKTFIIGWVDEHHLGQLATLPIVLALDCWEHAYMVDYLPGERGAYVSAYLDAVNWKTVNEWFEKITA